MASENPGLASFENRNGAKSKIYPYENPEAKFSPELEKQFKAHEKAKWKDNKYKK
jgi:hypothetical protein